MDYIDAGEGNDTIVVKISDLMNLGANEKITIHGGNGTDVVLLETNDTTAIFDFNEHVVFSGIEVIDYGSIDPTLVRVRDRIANGTSISDAFAMENLFPSLVVRMLRVGEATGALDEALSNVSYFYTRDIDESIGRVQALIEPVLTVVLGLILGWIMLAVLGPIYDTISKIRA